MKIGNLDIDKFYLGDSSDVKIYLGNVKLYPQDSPVVSTKFIGYYSDSTSYSENCDTDTTLTTVTTRAYSSPTAMTSAEIGECITSIGEAAFSGCSAMTSVVIPNTVQSFGVRSFFNCRKIPSINIPNGVTTIAERMFMNCYALSSITLPNTVTSIGNYAFMGCTGFTTMNIPSSVTSIGNNAFSNCKRLTSLSLPNSITNIGSYAFNNCSGLTNINIPSGITAISSSAFQGCKSLTNINIPSGVTSIGSYAFYDCSGLTSINIPSGVTRIDNYGFGNCRSLTSVTVNSVTPPTIPSASYYNPFINSTCPIYVPCESVSTYKTASGWNNVSSRISCTSSSTCDTWYNLTGGSNSYESTSSIESITIDYSCLKENMKDDGVDYMVFDLYGRYDSKYYVVVDRSGEFPYTVMFCGDLQDQETWFEVPSSSNGYVIDESYFGSEGIYKVEADEEWTSAIPNFYSCLTICNN